MNVVIFHKYKVCGCTTNHRYPLFQRVVALHMRGLTPCFFLKNSINFSEKETPTFVVEFRISIVDATWQGLKF